MRHLSFIAIISLFFLSQPVFANNENEFEPDEITTHIEKEFNLSKEEVDSLKPEIDKKSSSLKKSIHETVDKGFIEFDKLSEQLDLISKDMEQKAKTLLTSEEMTRLKEYLGKIDKQAINQAKESLIAEVSELLELSEQQAEKIIPILEESYTEISLLVSQYFKSGSESFQEYKGQYDEIIKDLSKKLDSILNDKQMDTFEEHSKQLENKIQQAAVAI